MFQLHLCIPSTREGLGDPVSDQNEFHMFCLSVEVALDLLCGQLFHQRGKPQLHPGTSFLFSDSLENTMNGFVVYVAKES